MMVGTSQERCEGMMKIISLGWGVQSWAMAAMVAMGEIEPIDFAIHSDTTWERESTYQFAEQWTPWLIERGVNVVTVSDRLVATAIYADAEMNKNVFIPAFGTNNNGQLRRQCTQRWKIAPMRRFIAAEMKRRGMAKTEGVIEQWLGITVDEIQRAKDGDVKYIKHRFPLIELKMTRADCEYWLKKNGLPTPGKSSCVFCPYQSKPRFEALKRANGSDWQIAKEIDLVIRDKQPPHNLYIHPGRKPLTEAVTIPEDYGGSQPGLFEEIDDSDAECDSGFCFN